MVRTSTSVSSVHILAIHVQWCEVVCIILNGCLSFVKVFSWCLQCLYISSHDLHFEFVWVLTRIAADTSKPDQSVCQCCSCDLCCTIDLLDSTYPVVAEQAVLVFRIKRSPHSIKLMLEEHNKEIRFFFHIRQKLCWGKKWCSQ